MTQTYLHSSEPDADVHVFYLFEDYVREQAEFTKLVQRELSRLGDVYEGDVSLVMPNPESVDKIEAEIRAVFKSAWPEVKQDLPALLVIRTPLDQVSDESEHLIIPFAGKDPSGVAEAIQEVRDNADRMLRTAARARSARERSKSVGRRFLEAIEWKPGFGGVKVDLRKLRNDKR